MKVHVKHTISAKDWAKLNEDQQRAAREPRKVVVLKIKRTTTKGTPMRGLEWELMGSSVSMTKRSNRVWNCKGLSHSRTKEIKAIIIVMAEVSSKTGYNWKKTSSLFNKRESTLSYRIEQG